MIEKIFASTRVEGNLMIKLTNLSYLRLKNEFYNKFKAII